MKKYLPYIFYCLAFLSIPLGAVFHNLWITMFGAAFFAGMGDHFHPNKKKRKVPIIVLAGLAALCVVAMVVVVLLMSGII